MARIKLANTIVEVDGRAISSSEYIICGKLSGSIRIAGEAIAGEISAGDLEIIREDPLVMLKEAGRPSCPPVEPSDSSIKLTEKRGKLRVLVNNAAYTCSEAILEYNGVDIVIAIGLSPLNVIVKSLNAKVSAKPLLHTLHISLSPANI